MPYSFAHIGYAIGLKKKWISKLSLNGLIFGSIAPDFDILFRFTNQRFHLFFPNLTTIILILMPLTIGLSVIFHRFTRNTIIENLPQNLSQRLKSNLDFNYIKWLRRNYKIESASIVIAIILHFLLDYFFHWNAYYYMKIIHIGIYPNHSLINFHYYFGWYFPMVVSTLIGFVLLYKLLGGKEMITTKLIEEIVLIKLTKKLFWLSLIIIAILFSFAKLYFFKYEGNGYAWHSVIIYITSGLVFSFFATPILYQLIKKLSSTS
ncbi:MAG: DUF4184 family protein [Chitinophagales bacterium]